jgi:hypothetical protein
MLARSARDDKVGGRNRRLGNVHEYGGGLVALSRSNTRQRATAGGEGAVGRDGLEECCEVQKAGRAIRREA